MQQLYAHRLCMGGLVGYMARIADEVALCQTTRKKGESEPIWGNEIDSEVLADQCSTEHPSCIINGLLTEPFHPGASIGQRVQCHECAGY